MASAVRRIMRFAGKVTPGYEEDTRIESSGDREANDLLF